MRTAKRTLADEADEPGEAAVPLDLETIGRNAAHTHSTSPPRFWFESTTKSVSLVAS